MLPAAPAPSHRSHAGTRPGPQPQPRGQCTPRGESLASPAPACTAPPGSALTWRGVWPNTSLSLRPLTGWSSSRSSTTTFSTSAWRPAGGEG